MGAVLARRQGLQGVHVGPEYRALHSRKQGAAASCASAFTSDVRIRAKATGLATYPHVSVVCGRQQTDPDDPKGSTRINPSLIVEVLSPSTEDYDRGEKLAHYKQIPSLDEVVLVAHEEPRLELWRREGDYWTLHVSRGEEPASVASLGCELSLADVYRNPLPGSD